MSPTASISTPTQFIKWPQPKGSQLPAPIVEDDKKTATTTCLETRNCQIVRYQPPLQVVHRIINHRQTLHKANPESEERTPASVAMVYQKTANMPYTNLGNKVDIRI